MIRRNKLPPPSGHKMVKLYQTIDQIRMLSVKPNYMTFKLIYIILKLIPLFSENTLRIYYKEQPVNVVL
jgi:hypothetical protein